MKAVVYTAHGDASHLVPSEIAQPEPLANQVLVKVSAASLNPCDFKMRRNWSPSLIVPKPKVPGGDIAGVVVSAPPQSRFKKGDRVAAMMPLVGSRWGAYAEYAAVREDFLARIPEVTGDCCRREHCPGLDEHVPRDRCLPVRVQGR